MMMPTMFPRVICQWYFLVSFHWPAMMLPNFRRGSGGGSGVSIARITCATANTPTSAGIGSMPPNRSVMPKVKRGTPPGFSIPIQETSRPRNMPAIAFTGEERATRVAHIRPSSASQKYSKVENDSATSASGGAKIISDSTPAMPPTAENQTPAPSASSAWPLRVMA
ncbi:hypothetical protein ACVILJ_007728 [Bradyrhizobium diazoefficiens]